MFPDKFHMCQGLPPIPGETGRTQRDPTGMGAGTEGN